jgi:polysaccharide pyruvyl transferase WcaK-like protein
MHNVEVRDTALKIVIFNARYSSNLGDGIIAESLESVLSSRSEEVIIETLDVGGKLGFGTSGLIRSSSISKLAKLVFRLLPAKLALAMAKLLTLQILKKRIAPIWLDQISSASLVVIGGGQLIADTDNYFPLRIKMICELAQECDVPYVIYAVGVSNREDFNSGNIEIFKECFDESDLFLGGTVRDKMSFENWKRLFAPSDIGIVPDPAFVISDLYDEMQKRPKTQEQGPETPESRAKMVVGIGLIAAAAVDAHTGAQEQCIKTVPDPDFFFQVAETILDAGYRVCFFTNGDAADEILKCKMEQCDFGSKRNDVRYAHRPNTPKELVKIISGFDCLLAHRLHALIVAHSFGVPTIAFMWDQKVQAFCEAISRERFLVRGNPAPKEVAALVREALTQKIHFEELQDLKDEVRKSSYRLIELASSKIDSRKT